jgi:hypothetical protein
VHFDQVNAAGRSKEVSPVEVMVYRRVSEVVKQVVSVQVVGRHEGDIQFKGT